MDRNIIATQIVEELEDIGALDTHNFTDAEAAMECVREIILEHLRDYLIVSGRLL